MRETTASAEPFETLAAFTVTYACRMAPSGTRYELAALRRASATKPGRNPERSSTYPLALQTTRVRPTR